MQFLQGVIFVLLVETLALVLATTQLQRKIDKITKKGKRNYGI